MSRMMRGKEGGKSGWSDRSNGRRDQSIAGFRMNGVIRTVMFHDVSSWYYNNLFCQIWCILSTLPFDCYLCALTMDIIVTVGIEHHVVGDEAVMMIIIYQWVWGKRMEEWQEKTRNITRCIKRHKECHMRIKLCTVSTCDTVIYPGLPVGCDIHLTNGRNGLIVLCLAKKHLNIVYVGHESWIMWMPKWERSERERCGVI